MPAVLRFGLPALILALVLASAALILGHDHRPDIDERFIEYTFDLFRWPHFDRGVSSDLVVGLFNRLDAFDAETSDSHVRALAMLLYLGAAGLLFGAAPFRHRPWVPFLCVGLLFTARFPFLWLASELLAGAWLMLALRAVLLERPAWQTSLWLGLFATARPDLALPAVATAAFLVWRGAATHAGRARLAATYAAPLVLLYLPGLVEYGGGFFEHSFYLRPEDRSESRAFYSLGQHYAALLFDHQLLPEAQRPSQWTHWKEWIHTVFGPDVNSVGALIRASPTRYLDFIFLSLSESVLNLLKGGLGLLLPAVYWAARRVERVDLRRVFALQLLTLVPTIALAYVHVRYLARLYPLCLFPLGLWLAQSPTGRAQRAAVALCVVVLLLQAWLLLPVLETGRWFVH